MASGTPSGADCFHLSLHAAAREVFITFTLINICTLMYHLKLVLAVASS